MHDLKCKCGMEYHITDEYIDVYKDEGKRCGCGEMMDALADTEQSKYVSKYDNFIVSEFGGEE